MDYLFCGDVAQRLGITTRRVQQMCKQGDFQGAKKDRGLWRIPENAIS